MKTEELPIAALKASPYNPRRISRHDFESLKRSIKEFGFVEPVVVNANDQIIGGHMRVEAAKTLGMTTAPVVRVDLDPKRERLLNIALNRIRGSWDEDKLTALLYEIQRLDPTVALDATGFHPEELERLLTETTTWRPSEVFPGKEEADGKMMEEVGFNLSTFWKNLNPESAKIWPYLATSFWKDLKVQDARISPYIMKPPPHKRGEIQYYSLTNPLALERIVRVYMRPGDTFLESCCGWGTFSTTAKYFGYSGEAIDIWDRALDFTRRQLDQVPGKGTVNVRRADARHLPFPDDHFSFAYCNPPFFNLERYSDQPEDLSNTNSYEQWTENMRVITAETRRALKPGGLAVFTMNDFRWKGRLMLAHADWQKLAEACGFHTHDIVVVEVRSQLLKFRRNEYDRRRCVKGHEYVMVFSK